MLVRRTRKQLPSDLSSPHKQDSPPGPACSRGQKIGKQETPPRCAGEGRQRRRGRLSRIPQGRKTTGCSTGSFLPSVWPTSPFGNPTFGDGHVTHRGHRGQASHRRKGPPGLRLCRAGHVSSTSHPSFGSSRTSHGLHGFPCFSHHPFLGTRLPGSWGLFPVSG